MEKERHENENGEEQGEIKNHLGMKHIIKRKDMNLIYVSKCHASPKNRPLPVLYICATSCGRQFQNFLRPSCMFDHWSR
jgi:hypothetical protein